MTILFLKKVNVFMINGVYFLHILIIKSQTTIFCLTSWRGSFVRFIQVVHLPIFNISTQLYYYWCWFVSQNLVYTPFSQLIIKNRIIIIPYMSWITFINILVLFNFCNLTWFSTGRFMKMICFYDTLQLIDDILPDLIVLIST